MVKILLGQRHKARTTAQIMELCQPVTLRDGLPLMAFTRHLRGLKEPTSRHTLRYTLGGPVLSQLLAQEGYLILYTHLGLPLPGAGRGTFSPAGPDRPGPPGPALSCRQDLGRPHGQGLEPLAHDPAPGLDHAPGR